MTGFLAILLVGLVLLALAAWRDRHTRLRLVEALGTAPEKLERPRTALDEQRSAELDAVRERARRLDAPLADARFATLGDGSSLVERAQVLCCPEGVGSLRELLPSLAAARAAMDPLVVALPWLDEALLSGLASHRGVLVLEASPQACEVLAALTGAGAAGRVELQSGMAHHLHGKAFRVLADPLRCWLEAVEA